MDSDSLKAGLVKHYDGAAEERETKGLVEFRAEYRGRFVDLLKGERIGEVVDLGAGTGHEAQWFAAQGIRVAALDLSPAHVELIRAKGIDARVGDFYELPWEAGRFRAVWCMSSIMHIPNADLGAVLDEFVRITALGGWLAVGMWGGDDTEGIWQQDFAEPKRFYALRSVGTMRRAFEKRFDIVELDEREVDNHSGWHYQWWLLQKPA